MGRRAVPPTDTAAPVARGGEWGEEVKRDRPTETRARGGSPRPWGKGGWLATSKPAAPRRARQGDSGHVNLTQEAIGGG